jgi:hypothetical protein
MLLMVVAMLFASFAVIPASPAVAAPDRGDLLKDIDVAGSATDEEGNITDFAGIVDIVSFSHSGEQLLADVLLTFEGEEFLIEDVPATLSKSSGSAAVSPFGNLAVAQVGVGASCDILFLQLGPLDLDLLGLVVELDQITLDIDAESGPGNLLGNLLCAVTGLLDNGGPLEGIINLLNAINNLLG